MGARTAICPACERRWPQRGARFCGHCGTPLTEVVLDDRPSRVARLGRATGWILAAAAGLALVGGVATIDLRTPASDESVELEDGLTPTGPRLTAAERQALRDQVDPDRLRCAPRGCELWRLDRDDVPAGHGVVVIDDGLLLTVGGRGVSGTVTVHEDGEQVADVVEHGHVLRALDPATGAEVWSRFLSTTPPRSIPDDQPSDDGVALDDGHVVDDGSGWLQLLPAPGGALAVTGRTVVGLDGRGEEMWRLHPPDDSPHEEWWPIPGGADVVVLNAIEWDPEGGGPEQTVIVVDARTGERLWSRPMWSVQVRDGVVVVADDTSTAALDERSGDPLWERPDEQLAWLGGGPAAWLITDSEDGTRLIDPGSGEVVVHLVSGFSTPLNRVGDRWIGVTRDDRFDDLGRRGPLELVALDDAGAIVWTVPIDELAEAHRWDCCQVRAHPSGGQVDVTSPSGDVDTYDVETGELVARNLAQDDGGATTGPLHMHTWQPAPGVTVEQRYDGRRIDIHTPDGSVSVTGRITDLESVDPLIVSDDDHLLGVRVGGGTSDGRRAPGS